MRSAAVGRSSDDFSDLALASAGCSLEDSLRLDEDSGSAPLEVQAAPEERWPEHAVPFTVSAKALLSEAAEVSATAAPRRSSNPSVLDRGRGSSLALLDTTGDGQPNLVGIDTTGDGFVDSLAVDTTGDGRVDHVCFAGAESTVLKHPDSGPLPQERNLKGSASGQISSAAGLIRTGPDTAILLVNYPRNDCRI